MSKDKGRSTKDELPTHQQRTPWYLKIARAIAFLFFAPVHLLVFLFLLLVGLYAGVAIVLWEVRFGVRMWRRGRFCVAANLLTGSNETVAAR